MTGTHGGNDYAEPTDEVQATASTTPQAGGRVPYGPGAQWSYPAYRPLAIQPACVGLTGPPTAGPLLRQPGLAWFPALATGLNPLGEGTL